MLEDQKLKKFSLKKLKKTKKIVEVPLGLEEDKFFNKIKSSSFTSLKNFNKKLKYSKILGNVWLLNIIFLNILMIGLVSFILKKYNPHLPKILGVQLFDQGVYDTVVKKSYLFGAIIFIHIFIIIFTFIFSFRSENKNNHLLALSLFNYVVIFFFEILALQKLILFFYNA